MFTWQNHVFLKSLLLFFLVIVLLQGCATTGVIIPSRLTGTLDNIGFYNDSPPEGTYEVLGYVKHQFNPLTNATGVQRALKMKAYSRYGSRVEAIIRVYETLVYPPYQSFPMREISGTAIHYNYKHKERRKEDRYEQSVKTEEFTEDKQKKFTDEEILSGEYLKPLEDNKK